VYGASALLAVFVCAAAWAEPFHRPAADPGPSYQPISEYRPPEIEPRWDYDRERPYVDERYPDAPRAQFARANEYPDDASDYLPDNPRLSAPSDNGRFDPYAGRDELAPPTTPVHYPRDLIDPLQPEFLADGMVGFRRWTTTG
jgi:hypothetical protein